MSRIIATVVASLTGSQINPLPRLLLGGGALGLIDPRSGKSWELAEARNPRSATLGILDDYTKVRLSRDWLEGESSVGGEIRHERILADTRSIPLHLDHFLDLLNNEEKTPEEWKKVKGGITFDGDVLFRRQGLRRHSLYLYWQKGERGWNFRWLEGKFNATFLSAVFDLE